MPSSSARWPRGTNQTREALDQRARGHAKRARDSAVRVHRPEARSEGTAPRGLSARPRIAGRAEGRADGGSAEGSPVHAASGGRRSARRSCAGRSATAFARSGRPRRTACAGGSRQRPGPRGVRAAAIRAAQIMIDARRARSAVRRTASPLRRVAARHPAVRAHAPDRRAQPRRACRSASRCCTSTTPSVVIGMLGDELIVGDLPMTKASIVDGRADSPLRSARHRAYHDFSSAGHHRRAAGRLQESSGSSRKHSAGDALKEAAAQLESPNIRVGRVTVDETRARGQPPTRRRSAACTPRPCRSPALFGRARAPDSAPDPTAAHSMIDGLAQAVVQNRSALMALTALKDYDNYTFTHMVNVSILTMAQARGLGIDGPLLREFGLAALMHDIGKVKTPAEILNKPDKLTDEEFAIMKRHVVDGAEILRGTPEIPALAPVVAFEHHLRLDGTGYPHGVVAADPEPCDHAVRHCRRVRCDALAAQISAGVSVGAHPCGAAAKRRQAVRSEPDPPLRAAARHLSGRQSREAESRRQSPSCCRCTRPIRIARKCACSSPPRARRLELPRDINLWEDRAGRAKGDRASSVIAPLNPADYGIDPLSFI